MPELPDVEILRRYFDSTALRRRIDDIDVRETRLVKGASRRKFTDVLRGHRFDRTRRYGKHLGARIDDGHWLVMHFGMTGDLKAFDLGDDEPAYAKVLFTFSDDHHLAYISRRGLGYLAITDDFDEFLCSKKLGPDALDVDRKAFREKLADRRGTIKAALMNQEVMAGVGNEYADEVLYQARIAPSCKVSQLDAKAVDRLHRTMQHVLAEAVKRDADPAQFPRTWLQPHRKSNGTCQRCGTKFRASTVSGRTTWWCPTCQQ